MKKLSLVFIVLAIFQNQNTSAQISFNYDEYFTFSTSIDPKASIDDGFIDIAAEIEYVGIIYAKAGIEYFPALEPSYFDFHGAFGANMHVGRFNPTRFYTGVRLGRIYRGSAKSNLLGFEGGIDFPFAKRYFIGLRSTLDYRQDGKHLGWDSFWIASGYVRLGIKF